MTHPQQDNPKGTKMTDKIDIDELIRKLENKRVNLTSAFQRLNGKISPNYNVALLDISKAEDGLSEAIAALTDMKAWEEIVRLVDELRKEEATSVCIVADNPDFDGPNNVIYLYDPVTDKDTPFYGDNVLDCLRKARQSKTNPKGDEL